MKFIRKSLVRKITFFATVLLFVVIALYFLTEDFKLPELTFGEFLLLTGFIVIISWIFFMWRIIWPIVEIARGTKEILKGKRYRRLEIENRSDELGSLANFFNVVNAGFEQIGGEFCARTRMTTELNFASEVQQKLLPKIIPVISGLDIAIKMQPLGELSGDNFDIISKKNSTIIYIGDATGHDASSSILMSMVNILIWAFTQESDDTREILIKTNKALAPKISAGMFMTLVMLRWEHISKKLFFTGCGHEHLLIFQAEKNYCKAVQSGGIALGMIPDAENNIHEKEIDFMVGDIVILFTDGITEAKNSSGEMFGTKRLQQLVSKYAHKKTAAEILDAILNNFMEFVGGSRNQKDDITLLVLRRYE